jgi:hypothetical protein
VDGHAIKAVWRMCEFLFYYGTRVTPDLIKKRFAGYAREKDNGRGLVDEKYDSAVAACFGWAEKKGSSDYQAPREYEPANYTLKKNKGWVCLDTLANLEDLGEYIDKYDYYGLPIVNTAGVEGFDLVTAVGPDCPLSEEQAPKRVALHTPEQGDKYILSLVARNVSNVTTREALIKGTTVPSLQQWMQPELTNGFEPKKYRLPIVAFFAVQKGYTPLDRPAEIVQPSRARAKAALARAGPPLEDGDAKLPRTEEAPLLPSDDEGEISDA